MVSYIIIGSGNMKLAVDNVDSLESTLGFS